jgi:hypothetical protein
VLHTLKHQQAAAIFTLFFFFWAESAEINKNIFADWCLEVCSPYSMNMTMRPVGLLASGAWWAGFSTSASILSWGRDLVWANLIKKLHHSQSL